MSDEMCKVVDAGLISGVTFLQEDVQWSSFEFKHCQNCSMCLKSIFIYHFFLLGYYRTFIIIWYEEIIFYLARSNGPTRSIQYETRGLIHTISFKIGKQVDSYH